MFEVCGSVEMCIHLSFHEIQWFFLFHGVENSKNFALI